jgi:hypothetical protein
LKKIKDKKVEIENDIKIVDVEEQAADYTVETDSTIDDMNNIYASAAADDAMHNDDHIFGNGDDNNFGFNDPFNDGSYTDHYYDDPGMDDGGWGF